MHWKVGHTVSVVWSSQMDYAFKLVVLDHCSHESNSQNRTNTQYIRFLRNDQIPNILRDIKFLLRLYLIYENHDIAIAMSFSRADPVLG